LLLAVFLRSVFGFGLWRTRILFLALLALAADLRVLLYESACVVIGDERGVGQIFSRGKVRNEIQSRRDDRQVLRPALKSPIRNELRAEQ
jgi:hypothetical protein